MSPTASLKIWKNIDVFISKFFRANICRLLALPPSEISQVFSVIWNPILGLLYLPYFWMDLFHRPPEVLPYPIESFPLTTSVSPYSRAKFRVGAPNPLEIGFWGQKLVETIPYQKVEKWSSFDHWGHFDPKGRKTLNLNSSNNSPKRSTKISMLIAIAYGYLRIKLQPPSSSRLWVMKVENSHWFLWEKSTFSKSLY